MSSQILAEGLSRPPSTNKNINEREASPPKKQTAESIQIWLVAQLATLLGVNANEISVREPFTYYGLDSVAAFSLSGDLEDLLERPLSPTLVWDYPTIEILAQHLAEEPPI